MQLYAVLVSDVLPYLVSAATDETPKPEDVKAGWTAFGIFLALGAAVALLGWGLTKQLRRTERNWKAGAFGPVSPAEDAAKSQVPAAEAPADGDRSAGAPVEEDGPR